jgi:hypothetical protein
VVATHQLGLSHNFHSEEGGDFGSPQDYKEFCVSLVREAYSSPKSFLIEIFGK